MRQVTVAVCQLNQWALDFEGNKERIEESIAEAKAKGATFRCGPELEVSGYGCNDHFLEPDTFHHSCEMLSELIANPANRDILVDVGMPVLHKGVRYNCRVIFYNGKILLIRPKTDLAMDGNYREGRWFTAWKKVKVVERFMLPSILKAATGQKHVPIGDGVVNALDCRIGVETCEELFTPRSPHIELGLDGVEIIANGSGSHHELRKLNTRVDLILSATSKLGGLYLYANHQGCDGERVYYDGCSMICMNGKMLAQASQFSLLDVEVLTATVDLDEVATYRASMMSRTSQAAESPSFPTADVDLEMSSETARAISRPVEPRYHTPQEEISLGPACWMWDYLRRSGLQGFFLPLSGGIDSSSTACLIASMCRQVVKAAATGDPQVLKDARRIAGKGDEYVPTDPAEFANHCFYTCYMGTSNSSEETNARAVNLAGEIGSHHLTINIDLAVEAITKIFVVSCGMTPKFKVHGGGHDENIALQNIQARLRMVLSYFFAQLLPWTRGRSGGLLVLGSANVDESLRGYLTKYDCSAADLNPIGGICKSDLRSFIAYAIDEFKFDELKEILGAPPTAELEPITEAHTQTDEEDMGMSYDELTQYGKLRKIEKCGPFSMYQRLSAVWSHLTVEQVATKVKFFFRMYAINRHKTTVLTPSYHAENYSPDDNRFDLRPFLYPRFTWQGRKIDEHVAATMATGGGGGGGAKV